MIILMINNAGLNISICDYEAIRPFNSPLRESFSTSQIRFAFVINYNMKV